MAWWRFAPLLLLLSLCPEAQTSSICSCNCSVRSVCAGPSDQVFVPCPGLDSDRSSLYLFQNQTELTSCHLTSCDPTRSWTNGSAPGHAVVLTNQSSGLGFSVTVGDERSHGLYVCEAFIKFPPPALRKTGPERVLVLVRGHQCGLKVEPRPGPVPVQSLVWVVSVVCLSSYSLFVSIVCVFLWVKSRSEQESDYVNTRPLPGNRRRRRSWRLKEIHVHT